jgi:hypothetical protein
MNNENIANVVTGENPIQDVINKARLPICRRPEILCTQYQVRNLQDVAFPMLEQALSAIIIDIESDVVLLRSGGYYDNHPKLPLSILFKAAANIMDELEFRKACYWGADFSSF